MNISQFLNILLATALVLLSVKIAFFTGSESTMADTADTVMNNILTRTSIRSYQEKPVEETKVEQLLRAGMAAPTAVNKQPWAFVVVKDPEQLQRLGDVLPYAKMTAQAPLAIVVCGDLNKALPDDAAAFWIQDASAATENILLAANGLGLGAVWTGVYPSEERVKDVSQLLQLPSHIIPLNVIPIGYPAEQPTPKDKWNPENIHYDRWN